MLVLLYYLSQNPDFAENVRPIMSQLKDSQQMLNFLNDLSKFSKNFGGFDFSPQQKQSEPPPEPTEKEEKNPQSPTAGIADDFIQNILDSYLKNKG